jgi:hypothetical protein
MNEDLSRRKALSLLGLGAVLGLTASALLTPSQAEAEDAAAPAAAPAKTSGTHGMNRRQDRRHGRHDRRDTRRGHKPEATPAEAAPK